LFPDSKNRFPTPQKSWGVNNASVVSNDSAKGRYFWQILEFFAFQNFKKSKFFGKEKPFLH
jgi:hypothetical protein